MSEILAGFVGNPSSGKSRLTSHLSTTLEIPRVTGSDIIKGWALERGVSLNKRPDFTAFQLRMRQELGPNCLMQAMLTHRNEAGLIIDGLRNIQDYNMFKEEGGLTIATWCPLTERFRRAQEDGDQKNAICSIEQFQQAEAVEYADASLVGQHTVTIMQMADVSVDASSPLDRVRAEVEALLLASAS